MPLSRKPRPVRTVNRATVPGLLLRLATGAWGSIAKFGVVLTFTALLLVLTLRLLAPITIEMGPIQVEYPVKPVAPIVLCDRQPPEQV